jgi:hypothetical protein
MASATISKLACASLVFFPLLGGCSEPKNEVLSDCPLISEATFNTAVDRGEVADYVVSQAPGSMTLTLGHYEKKKREKCTKLVSFFGQCEQPNDYYVSLKTHTGGQFYTMIPAGQKYRFPLAHKTLPCVLIATSLAADTKQ